MQTLKFIVLSSALAMLAGPLAAQPTAPRPAASAASEAAVSERARREAASPMYWIRIHSERPPEERKGAAPPRPETAAKQNAAPNSAAPAQAANPVSSAELAPAIRAAGGKATTAPNSPPVANQLANQGGDTPTGAASRSLPPPAAAEAATAARPQPAQTAGLVGAAALAASTPSNAAGADQKVASLQAAPLPAGPPPSLSTAPEPEPAEETLVLLSGSEPRFPDSLMRRLRRGAVTMRVDVGTDGAVRRASVVTSSNPRLETAAVEAAQAMRFQPVRRPASADINFSFDLDL